ncbi:MAG: S46 family peptidase [Candidatus Moduliflexus flocculans]|nr:S46 family peptidase [Candidatus Moduliflexus flocculans]
MKNTVRYFAIAALVLALSLVSGADDGMWMPHQMKSLDLKALGLRMDPGELYKTDGTGLMSAVVNLGGGTGEFVSPEGLVLTNHHVAYGAIQQGLEQGEGLHQRRLPGPDAGRGDRWPKDTRSASCSATTT